MRRLGWAYGDSEFGMHNPCAAARWFGMAALLDDPESQCALGEMFAWGLGLPCDMQKAVRWTQLAAERNYVEALCQLGWYFFEGNAVVPKDHSQSFRCFERAALVGDKGARCNCTILSRMAGGWGEERSSHAESLIPRLGFRTVEQYQVWMNLEQPVLNRLLSHRSHAQGLPPDDETATIVRLTSNEFVVAKTV